MTEMSIS